MDQIEIDRAVLWYFGDEGLGRQPGSFVHRLLRTIAVADQENRAKLADGFPEIVAAFIEVSLTVGGLEAMRARVREALVRS